MVSGSTKSKHLHAWDGKTLLKSILAGSVLEAAAIAPVILSPWGHAGPESLAGWLGLLLNVPGLLVIWLIRIMTGSRESISMGSAIAYVYSIQALILSYAVFVRLRWKKRHLPHK
jgi:ABC-type sugar transport system permease subunit